jgi:hypothetical protein
MWFEVASFRDFRVRYIRLNFRAYLMHYLYQVAQSAHTKAANNTYALILKCGLPLAHQNK